MLNKKDLRKVLEGVLPISIEIWQDKPWTAVKAVSEYNGSVYERFGFAKVQYPDVWDADCGVQRAKDKAVAKITKAIVNGETA